MRKTLAIFITITLLVALITGASLLVNNKSQKDLTKIQVIATLFPQYDFVKNIGGDKVEVSILLPSGVESHNFEPTPQNIIDINKSSLFVYTGEYMEPWAKTIINGIDSNTKILDLSKGISLIDTEEFEEAFGSAHEDEDHHKEEIHEHEHEYDPHIWLDPQNAIKMVISIKDMLCEIDSDNSEYYNKNATQYINKLVALDLEIQTAVEEAKEPIIAFGGPFAYSYFIQRYDLKFISAYDSCGEQAEPSIAKVKDVIDGIKEHSIPVIFYQELSEGNIAKTIADETGTTPLVFHSVHNASKDEISNGASYISLMEQNLENLKIALNVSD